MTVQDLMDILQDADPNSEVRLAMQPAWPFEYSIGDALVFYAEDDTETVYLVEGQQLNYLPGDVAAELGW